MLLVRLAEQLRRAQPETNRENFQVAKAHRAHPLGRVRLRRAFAMAKIAGHSSISITQRYVPPQAEAIAQAFKRVAGSADLALVGRSDTLSKDKQQ